MKKVDISFEKASDPKIKTGATVLVEDDVDTADILDHFRGTSDFGWVITGVECVGHNIRIEQLWPREY